MRLALTLPCGSPMEPISYTTPIPYIIIGGLRIIEHWLIRLINEASVVLNVEQTHVHRNRLLISELGIPLNIEYSSNADAYVNPCIIPYTSNVKAVVKHISNNESVTCGGYDLIKIKDGGRIINDCSIEFIKGPWDIIKHNNTLLKETIEVLAGIIGLRGSVMLYGSEASGDVKFNTSEGPVLVVKSSINVPAYIKGPALIGVGTVLSPFTYIREGTVAYMEDRLSGEIKNSLIDCCTFKEHYGYLGDSYVGKWVNFGAGTTVSNLKNTLGTVRFRGIDTGMVKLGPIIGDWVKTGINTSIMTGKAIGPGSHVYGLVTVDTPPFTIYTGELIAFNREKVHEVILKTTRSNEEAEYALRIYDSTLSLRSGIKMSGYKLP
ncbi:sugar phosphate transferase [Caldivirga maquilingensis]|uniref:Sugar phospate transferase n=1 Tax=Caldivirga maquilingensis (strain ATCC 700844 / DSM 13496 / JCM 10307 / IC-167) TaxID=397948 RepID=A8M9F2_CALMQ|nr:sugar phosphate transferase [Caldivirga maquilingensis]ABW02371.1 sugar phospate transferase [Caldivirga maquilingensis IC-167]